MRRLILSTVLLAFAGCTGPDFSDEYRPIVDYQASLHRGVNYEADLDVCQSYARSVHPPQDTPFIERRLIVECMEQRGYAVLPQTGWRGTAPIYR